MVCIISVRSFSNSCDRLERWRSVTLRGLRDVRCLSEVDLTSFCVSESEYLVSRDLGLVVLWGTPCLGLLVGLGLWGLITSSLMSLSGGSSVEDDAVDRFSL